MFRERVDRTLRDLNLGRERFGDRVEVAIHGVDPNRVAAAVRSAWRAEKEKRVDASNTEAFFSRFVDELEQHETHEVQT